MVSLGSDGPTLQCSSPQTPSPGSPAKVGTMADLNKVCAHFRYDRCTHVHVTLIANAWQLPTLLMTLEGRRPDSSPLVGSSFLPTVRRPYLFPCCCT